MRASGPRGPVCAGASVCRPLNKGLLPHGNAVLPVSEAPKEAPARKFVPASVYLAEKSDEQKKEEVGAGALRTILVLGI